jgi:hypothetical protein
MPGFFCSAKLRKNENTKSASPTKSDPLGGAECMFEYCKQEYPHLDIFLVKLEASESRCSSRTAKRATAFMSWLTAS